MIAPSSTPPPARPGYPRNPGGAARTRPFGRAAAWVQAILAGSLLLLLVLPLVALLISVPGADLLAVARDPGVRTSLGFTLLASGISLVVVVGLGVPLGYVLARRTFPGRSVIESAVTLPIVLPHLVGGLALLLLFAPRSPLGALAIRAGFPVFETIWGTVLVMVYVSASYTVLASQVAFQAVEGRLIEAARSLGASPSEVFATVSFPLAARGILTGALLSWARAISEIGGFLIVAYTVYPSPPYGGPVTTPISVYVYNLYQIGDLNGATAAASFLVIVAFVIFLTVRLLARHGSGIWRRAVLAPP